MRALYLAAFAVFCATLTFAQSPGNVSSGISVWLKADAGVEEGPGDNAEHGDAITTWLDQSGNGRHYVAVAGPTLQTISLNYNSAVQILAGGFDAPVTAPLGTNWSVFFVSKKLASDNNGRLFDGHAGNFLWAHWANYRNSLYLNGSPSNHNTGIATTSGIEALHLHSYIREATGNTVDARADGTSLNVFAATNSASGTRIDINTGAFSAGESSHSQVGEMIIYNSALSAAEVIRVESYLAAKYGLTIAHNYVASDGSSIFWDFAADAAFNNNIAAIGRDDNSALDQRTSSSINGTNLIVSKPGGFGSNLGFVAWGDNNLTALSTNVGSGYTFRSNRIWRSDITGTPGAVDVSLDLNALGIPNTTVPTQYALLTSADQDFSSGASALALGSSFVGNVITFNNVSLNDSEYFTIAVSNAVNPGGVSTGLSVWLKANDGVLEGASDPAESGDAITAWQDASGFGNNYTAVAGPTLVDASLNYNPSVEILSGGFDAPASAALSATWTTFFISRKLPSDQSGRLFDGHAGNFLWAHWDVWRNSLYLNNNPGNHNTGIASNTGIQNLHLHTYKRESSGSLEARVEGTILNTFGTSASAAGVRIDINQGASAAESSDAQVGEMIIYTGALTADEVNRVESYLGVKYGLTLDHNYLASDGTVLWDNVANSAYHNDVTAIGRDDNSGLSQQQSIAMTATGAVSMNKGGAFASDKDFLFWGSNTATGTSNNIPLAYTWRTNKIWKTETTGTPGPVSVSVNLALAGLPNSGNAADYTLLIDTDTDFSAGATAHTTGASLVGQTLTFTNATFADGDYFAFAVANLQQPGGVVGTVFWVKGDNGVTGVADVSRWADQNGLNNDAFQNTVAQQPSLLASNINGHSVIEFSGTSDIFQITTAPANLNTTVFTVGATNNNSGYRTMFRGATNDHPILMNNGTANLGYWDSDGGGFKASGFTIVPNEVAIIGLEMYTGDVNFRKNGTQGASNATINLAGLNLNYFGNCQCTGQPWGRIAETIIYSSATPLTTTEKQKIESYLAIKYGVTLSHDYLASDGVVLWNTTTNAAYSNFITGIGRDDNTSLDQRSSTSVATGAAVTITKSGAFGTDKDALIVGSDLALGTSTNIPAPYLARASRVWKSSVRGTPGNIDVAINLVNAGFPVGGSSADYALLIDNDTDFSTGAAVHTAGASLVGNTISFSGVSIADGQFFTVAAQNIPLPGGVAGNVFWVMGDVGVTGTTNISNWADQSGSSNHAVQSNGTIQPSLLNSNINFHNTVQFTGNQILQMTNAPTNLNTTVFVAGAPAVNSAWRTLFRGTAGDHPVIVESGNVRLGYYDGDGGGFQNSGFTWLQNEVALVGAEFRTGDVNFRKNGTQGNSITTINLAGLSLNYFGNFQSGGQPFGRIAETIIFNGTTPLTTTEKERIESYLAAKYGITLTHNYIASDDAIFWNTTTNASHNNNVTVVGRDDRSGLDQRVSVSTQSSATITVTKSGAFGTNYDLLVIGNTTAIGTSTNVPGGFLARTARTWKSAVRGTPGSVDFTINLLTAGLAVTGSAADYALLIDSDTDFSAGAATHTTGAALVGNQLTFTNVALTDGQYFAVAANNITMPGGVAGNVLWVKGDVGVTGTTNVTLWADQSGTGNDLFMNNVANQPSLTSSNINSHDVVTFTSTDVMQLTTAPTTTNSTVFLIGAPNVNSGWRAALRSSGNNDWPIIVENNNTRLGYYDADNAGFKISGLTWTQDEVALVASEYQTGNVVFRKNGTAGTAITTINLGANITYLGGHEASAQSFGRIGEALIFNTTTPLSTNEKERIESYLAIKYGITLTHHYIASDNTVIWNTTTNSAYGTNIVGIARDDNSSLDQRSSVSAHNGIVTVSKTTAGPFGSNYDALIVGNDGSIGTSTNVPAGFDARTARVWTTAVRGTPGQVDMAFNLATAGLVITGVVGDYALLIDSDTDFSAGATEHTTGASLVGNVLSFTNVSLSSGQFFTIATRNMALPGGVAGNVLWVKADVGVTGTTNVNSWEDQSGTGNHLFQNTGAVQPSLLTANINSHASISFSGNDFMQLTTQPTTLNSSIFVVGAPLASSNWRALVRNSANDWPVIVQSNATGIGYYDVDNVGYKSSGFNWAADEVALLGAEYYTANVNFRKNGTQGASITTINNATGNTTYIGGHEASTQPFGRIAEALIFRTPSPLTSAEKERVESYLAIKYGITLTHNYVSSDGTVLWNSTTNSSYNNNITGIGRDDESTLDQQVSQGVHSGNTIALDKGGAFGSDFDFLIIGNTSAVGVTGNVPPAFAGRTNRTWKTAVRGTPGAVAITIDISNAAFINTGNAADYALLIDSDTDFSTGATVHTTGASLVGNLLSFTGVTFTDNNFFAVASANAVFPGGVNGAVFWVRADAGVTGTTDVSSWADQSLNSNNAVQATVSNQPTLVANTFNSNPVIDFTVVNDIFQLTIPPANLNSVVFTVASPAPNTAYRTMFRGTAADHPLIINTGTNNLGYYDNDNVGFKSGGFTWAQNEIAVVALEMRAGDVNFRKNGSQGTSIGTINLAGLNLNYFGNYQGGGQRFGRIAETMIYNTAGPMSSADKVMVESYLALKYGITLTHNYVATDGTVTWNFTSNATYHNNVTGIGRDDVTALDQRASFSVHSGGTVTMERTSAFGTNRSFLIWGNNTAAMNSGGVTDFPSGEGVIARLARVWKVGVTGTPGAVDLRVDLSTVPGTKNAADLRLVIDRNLNGLFSDETVVGGGIISGATLVSGSTFQFSGVTFNNDELFSIASANSTTPLPITLTRFVAEQRGDVVHLEWTTNSEVNNDFFTIERSDNGVEFAPLGIVKGAGTTSVRQQYGYADITPSVGDNYYRLRQTDFDKKFTYSNVVRVQFFSALKLYPNPARDQVTVEGDELESAIVTVTNVIGQKLNTTPKPDGRNVIVNLNGIAPGIYFLTVNRQGKVETMKFVVE